MNRFENGSLIVDPTEIGFSSRVFAIPRPSANGHSKPLPQIKPAFAAGFRAGIISIDQAKSAINYKPEIFDVLPQRELEVLSLMAEGLTQDQIADRLGLSKKTVQNHAFRGYKKLGKEITKREANFMLLIRIKEGYKKSEEEPNPTPLTKREKEVARLIREGVSNDEIAQALGGLSVRTAENHVWRVYNKLGIPRTKRAARQLLIAKKRGNGYHSQNGQSQDGTNPSLEILVEQGKRT